MRGFSDDLRLDYDDEELIDEEPTECECGSVATISTSEHDFCDDCYDHYVSGFGME